MLIEDCLRNENFESEKVCVICVYKYVCIYVGYNYFDDGEDVPFYNGALELVCAGCIYDYHLILNSPCRGEVFRKNV